MIIPGKIKSLQKRKKQLRRYGNIVQGQPFFPENYKNSILLDKVEF